MRRLLGLTMLVVFAAGCSGGHGSNDAVSLSDVTRVLGDAHLRPQKVKVVVTIAKAGDPPAGPVNYCAVEAIGQDAATSLDVDRGRAIVMVFESLRDASRWTARPECGAKPMRVANVIAVPTHGDISPRLRAALGELRPG